MNILVYLVQYGPRFTPSIDLLTFYSSINKEMPLMGVLLLITLHCLRSNHLHKIRNFAFRFHVSEYTIYDNFITIYKIICDMGIFFSVFVVRFIKIEQNFFLFCWIIFAYQNLSVKLEKNGRRIVFFLSK